MKKNLLISITLIMFIGCSGSNDKDWTILIYMAADNGLNDAALDDIAEMQAAVFSEDINVIVQIDHSENNETTGAYRYHIYPGEKNQVSYLGEINSGDWHSITDFANWGFNKYPADKNALFLWSHGNGWYPMNRTLDPCFCPDEESQDYISIAGGDLNNAIKNINAHLDILVFDACNMQTIEVAAEIYNYTDFIIGAEDGISSEGFPYEKILSNWENYSGVENTAEGIGFNFHEFCWLNNFSPISCSVIKTACFENVLNDISEFSEIWSEDASDEIFYLSREDCIEFNDSWVSQAVDVDVKEFFCRILNNEPADSTLTAFCIRIISGVDSCFILQDAGFYTGYTSDYVGTGLIWFPDDETQIYYENRLEEYLKLEFSETNWQVFLGNFLQ